MVVASACTGLKETCCLAQANINSHFSSQIATTNVVNLSMIVVSTFSFATSIRGSFHWISFLVYGAWDCAKSIASIHSLALLLMITWIFISSFWWAKKFLRSQIASRIKAISKLHCWESSFDYWECPIN